MNISSENADCVHPCPCGYYGDAQRFCTCSLATVTEYQKRISGPMRDRIDIHIQVPRVLKLAEALHVIPVKTG